jgi:plastocyanin domain-containing protein
MTVKMIVTIAGLALVIFVNWYFFLSKKRKT